MATRVLDRLIQAWCEAQTQWTKEVYGGGYPRIQTRRRLYYAGRALFEHAGVTPKGGIYERNLRLEQEREGYNK